MSLSDRLFKLGFWVGLPTVHLTEHHPKKWVRVVGFLMIFPLSPLAFLSLPIIFVAMVAEVIEEI